MPLCAQKNYVEGYIVRTGKDTVRGRIDYRDWVATPLRIDFQDSHTGRQDAYTPRELEAFSVNGEVYRSYGVRVAPYSQDPAVAAAIDWHGEPYDTTIFLRLVTSGRLSLYYYRDQLDVTYFFVQREGKAPEQLQIRDRVVRKGAKTDVIADEAYKYQLADLVSSCSLVAERPVPVAYEENALKKLIDTYNHCGMEVGGRKHSPVSFMLMAGYLHSSVRPGGNTDAAHAGWPAYNGPVGGVGVLFQPTKGRKRWALLADALYDRFSVNSSKFQKDYYETYSGKLDYDEVRIDVQLRYLFPAGDWRPFIGVGFSNSLIINNSSSQSVFDASTAQTIHQPLFGDKSYIQTYRPGGFLALGAIWKRWSLEARYERTAGLVNLAGISAPVGNFYVLAGFRL